MVLWRNVLDLNKSVLNNKNKTNKALFTPNVDS